MLISKCESINIVNNTPSYTKQRFTRAKIKSVPNWSTTTSYLLNSKTILMCLSTHFQLDICLPKVFAFTFYVLLIHSVSCRENHIFENKLLNRRKFCKILASVKRSVVTVAILKSGPPLSGRHAYQKTICDDV